MARRRDEAGVAAIVLALAVAFIIVPLGAYGVDLGMQRVARRDMQSLADVVALDLARQLNGGPLSGYDFAGLQLAAHDSLCRNDDTVGQVADGSGCGTSSAKKADVTFELGTTTPALYGTDGYFTPMANQDGTYVGASTGVSVPTAVRVIAETDVAFGLANALPGGGISHGSASRAAVAAAKPSGCFSIGSFALGIETGNPALLGALLNDNLGISGQVVGYEGLADADVTVGDLVAAAKVGSVSELANVKASTLYTELAGTQIGDAATLQLLGMIGGSAKLDPNLTVGDMIDLTGAGADVLDSNINLLDLVSSSLAISNGTHFIDAGTAVSVPGLGGLKIGLQVIERPRMACGTGQASTGQVRLQITGSVAGLINLDLGVVLAQAKGRITDIACTAGAPTTMTVQTSDQALVALDTTASVLSGTPATPSPTQVVGSGSSYPIPLTAANYDDGYATNSGAVLVPTLTLGLLGIDLGGVSNLVLSPLLSPLSVALTTLLKTSLGITVAGAKIWPHRTPTCGQPMLVG